MNDIEILKEMFTPCVQVPLQQDPGKPPSVKLTDVQAQTTVTIKGLPQKTVVLRAEVFVPFADINNAENKFIFNGSKGECKRADFVIVSNGSRNWIIFIETQRGNYKSRQEVVQQLKGALCLLNYCKSIGKEFWLEEEFLDGYEYRFVSLKDINIDKKSTPPEEFGNILHCHPKDFRRLFGRGHYFRKLTDRGP